MARVATNLYFDAGSVEVVLEVLRSARLFSDGLRLLCQRKVLGQAVVYNSSAQGEKSVRFVFGNGA